MRLSRHQIQGALLHELGAQTRTAPGILIKGTHVFLHLGLHL
jgi:hypothetical protein